MTKVNVDDRKLVSEIVDELLGCLYGNKYYISSLLEQELTDKGVTLITRVTKI
ncbi:Mobile element protein [Candidatus Enterovibrio escicola]|uniref:Mobile element protein n=1 Tax=Candidatus Enterovibrio escicola TaxID=1927127 RepID=A0A2A5SZN4_9GAMM|nr:transposase [Candidatus Enterovibrio escacola]PCS21356.1 Mobile element protein [Candidatus Enterovibrio escacola]